MGDDLGELMDVEPWCRWRHVGRSTWYRIMRPAGFPVVRIGRRVLIPVTMADAWLRRHVEIEGAEQAVGTEKPHTAPAAEGRTERARTPRGGRLTGRRAAR